MRRIVIATALVAGLAFTVAAVQASGGSSAGPLWATVNVCDPASHSVGVRASLAGNGTRQRMRVRFTAQWYSRARGAWLPVQGASSPWLDAGSAQYVYQQAGWTFFLDPPSPGTHVDVRGVAQMQWLDGGRVARSATSVTTGGVASDVGASAATCTIG